MAKTNLNGNVNENIAEDLSENDIEKEIAELKALHESDVKKIEELTAASADFKDKWYRTAAEYENFRKRNAETRRCALEEGKTEAVKKILFVGDNLERALSFEIDEKTKEGLSMLLRQYEEVLTNLGLETINPVGEVFDPNFHEAIFVKEAEGDQVENTVESVFLKGYKMGEKIIRYAQVVVVK